MTIFSALLVAASVAAVSAEPSEKQYHEKVATDLFLKVVTPVMNSHDQLAARTWHDNFVQQHEERTGTSSPLASFSECSTAPPSSPVLGSSVQLFGICSILCSAAYAACNAACGAVGSKGTCKTACTVVETACNAAC